MKILKTLANILRDKYFIVFALFWGMLYFTQLYAKLGYLATSFMFRGNEVLAYSSAVVFGCFAGTANIALILGNKSEKNDVSWQIMTFDMTISFFFYGGVFMEAYNTGTAKDIGTAIGTVIMGIYSSYLIYMLAERFRKNNIEEDKTVAENNTYEKAVKDLLVSWNVSLPTGKETVADMLQIVASSYQDLKTATNLVAGEAESLRPLSEEVQTLREQLRTATKDGEEARNKLAEFTQTINTEKERSRRLTEDLEEARGQASRLNDTNRLRSEKASLTKFVNGREWNKAKEKQKQIKKEFGEFIKIDFPEEVEATA